MWSASSFSGHLGDSKPSQDLLFRLTGASFATRWHLVVRARNSLFHEASMRASAQRTGQRETEIALLESMLRNQVTRLLMPYEQCQTRLIILRVELHVARQSAVDHSSIQVLVWEKTRIQTNFEARGGVCIPGGEEAEAAGRCLSSYHTFCSLRTGYKW